MAILDLADHVLSFFPVRKPGDDTPAEGDDLDAMTFFLGTREKTRFSPVKLYLRRAGGRFDIAGHPDDERVQAIAEVLAAKELTKTDFLKTIKRECGFGKDLAGRLLKVGESRGVWESVPAGKNNATVYRLRLVGGGTPPYKGGGDTRQPHESSGKRVPFEETRVNGPQTPGRQGLSGDFDDNPATRRPGPSEDDLPDVEVL